MADEKDKDRKELKDYGIIYVAGDLDEESSAQVCREIIEMNVVGEVEHIQMVINSPGGSCTAGFAIIDIMEWSRIPVYTTGLGIVASMSLLLLMTGEKGRRVITPRTALLSHRYFGVSWGRHSQLLAGRKEEDLMHERIVAHYLRYTRLKSKEELEQRLLRDVDAWLTPEEAVEFGIVDIVERLNRQRLEPGR